MGKSKQVGALPWRRGETGVEVLLVTTRTTGRWVIPKGWPMRDKADHDAAAQEALEEAGIAGTVDPLVFGNFGYIKIGDTGKPRHVTVDVYLLAVERELVDWPERHERERRWMSPSEAITCAGEPELVGIFKLFKQSVGTTGVQSQPNDGAVLAQKNAENSILETFGTLISKWLKP